MNKILEMKFGSHLYGTNTENSDMDFKGIYLPTAREIVLGTYKKTICSSRPKGLCERNTKKGSNLTSKYLGVSWDKARHLWRASIMFNRKTFALGRFSNEEDAARAYNEASKKYFKEFAKLNSI